MTLPISNNYQEYQMVSNQNKVKVEEDLKTVEIQEDTSSQEDERHLSKEEANALLVQYQATQVMKNRVDTYFDSPIEDEDDELNFEDIRDVNKLLNRAELIDYHKEERFTIQEKDSDFEMWA